MADAFQQYCREVREQVKKETPDLGYNDMTKELDKRWNNEEDKTKWEHAAQAYVFRAKVRAGELAGVKGLLKENPKFESVVNQPSETLRAWTPLHTAVWGTQKPQYDKDIIEQILAAAKKAGNGAEAQARAAKDALDGALPLDLAKQRMAKHEENPPKPGSDENAYLDEKRKLEKVIEWLEKGLPAS